MPPDDIGAEEILAAADSIDATLQRLEEARDHADARRLTEGAWPSPGSASTFATKWSEWTAGRDAMLEVGPGLSQWLRNYAAEAEAEGEGE